MLAGAFIQSLCPCTIYIIQAILEASLNEDARVEDVDVDNSGTDASVGNAGHDAGVTSDILRCRTVPGNNCPNPRHITAGNYEYNILVHLLAISSHTDLPSVFLSFFLDDSLRADRAALRSDNIVILHPAIPEEEMREIPGFTCGFQNSSKITQHARFSMPVPPSNESGGCSKDSGAQRDLRSSRTKPYNHTTINGDPHQT
jgi:hypothetical protein